MHLCCSVTQLYPTVCDPMDCSTPGFSVLHYPLEFAQTYFHWVTAAHPLSPPFLLLPSIFPIIKVFSNVVSSSHQVAKVLHLQPQQQSFLWTLRVVRIDWFDLPAVLGTLKSLLWHHSSKASILWCSAFFIAQLSHICTRLLEKPKLWLSGSLSAKWCLCFLICCLGLSQLSFQEVSFNFMAAVTICSDLGAHENKACHCFHFFPHLFAMKWWDWMPWS